MEACLRSRQLGVGRQAGARGGSSRHHGSALLAAHLRLQEDTVEVPAEETLGEIRRRYLALNSHALSYVWKGLTVSTATPAAAGGWHTCMEPPAALPVATELVAQRSWHAAGGAGRDQAQGQPQCMGRAALACTWARQAPSVRVSFFTWAAASCMCVPVRAVLTCRAISGGQGSNSSSSHSSRTGHWGSSVC